MENASIVTWQAMHRWTLFHLYACWENPKPFKITLRVAARFYKTLIWPFCFTVPF
jgi:hypothetical protein